MYKLEKSNTQSYLMKVTAECRTLWIESPCWWTFPTVLTYHNYESQPVKKISLT